MTFIVMKGAGDEHWFYFWPLDPRVTGVLQSDSVAYTKIGLSNCIKPVYEHKEDAMSAAVFLNGIDPEGGYDVCPQIKLRCVSSQVNLEPTCV